MRLGLLLALVVTSAQAQVQVFSGTFSGTVSGGGAGGGSGGGTTTVSELGTCDTDADGNEVWLAPSDKLYVCDGDNSAWRQVYTSQDGVLPTPDTAVPGAYFVANASTGYAFRVAVAGVRVGIGPGANSYFVQQGTTLFTPFLSSNQFSADAYTALNFGTVTNLNNPVSGWSINSTTAIKGVVRATVSVDFASISNGTCLAQTVTVTGAALGDHVSVNANFALPPTLGIGNARVTATNAVDLRLCNHDPTNSVDAPAGNFIFRLER